MSENDLYEQIAHYMVMWHKDVLFHFDLSGMWTPSHKARNLYGRLNRRAWPDLFIPVPAGAYAGLFIELKIERARLKKRDGQWATPHIAEQAAVLEGLAAQGYIAQFACGLTEATSIIDSYLAKASEGSVWSGDDFWPEADDPQVAAA